MFGGSIDPKGAAQVRAVGSRIKGEIVIDLKTDTLSMTLKAEDEQAGKMAKKLIDQMGSLLAQQIKMMFGVNGSIRQIGKLD